MATTVCLGANRAACDAMNQETAPTQPTRQCNKLVHLSVHSSGCEPELEAVSLKEGVGERVGGAEGGGGRTFVDAGSKIVNGDERANTD